jgi:hypothetical protein
MVLLHQSISRFCPCFWLLCHACLPKPLYPFVSLESIKQLYLYVQLLAYVCGSYYYYYYYFYFYYDVNLGLLGAGFVCVIFQSYNLKRFANFAMFVSVVQQKIDVMTNTSVHCGFLLRCFIYTTELQYTNIYN